MVALQGAHLVSKSSYDLLAQDQAPQRIPALKSDPQKPNPKLGVGLVQVCLCMCALRVRMRMCVRARTCVRVRARTHTCVRAFVCTRACACVSPESVLNVFGLGVGVGVSAVQWSADSSLILSRADDLPNALFIWDARQLSLFALCLQLAPIRDAK